MNSLVFRRLLLVLVTLALAGGAFAVGLATDGSSKPVRSLVAAPVTAGVSSSPSVVADASALDLHYVLQQCREKVAAGNLHPAGGLGSPIVYRQGSYTAVLFVDKRDFTYFCSYQPSITGDIGFNAYPMRGDPAPAADSVDFRQGADFTCYFPSKPWPGTPQGELYGFAGDEVASASFQFAHESSSIKALVKRGFYIVEWSYPEWPDQVTVRTNAGKIAHHAVPRDLNSQAQFFEACRPHP